MMSGDGELLKLERSATAWRRSARQTLRRTRYQTRIDTTAGAAVLRWGAAIVPRSKQVHRIVGRFYELAQGTDGARKINRGGKLHRGCSSGCGVRRHAAIVSRLEGARLRRCRTRLGAARALP